MKSTIITGLLVAALATFSPQASASEMITGTNWVGRDTDGSVRAFVVRGNEVQVWGQDPGETVTLRAPGPLAAAVSVVPNADGRLQVFARRLDTGEVVTLWQTAPNGGFHPAWQSLGRLAGTPVAALGADGRIRVVVADEGKIRRLTQALPNAGFPADWEELGAADGVQGLAVRGDEVFGHVGHRIRHWAGGTATDLDLPEPVGPPTVSGNEIYYRTAGGIARAFRADDVWTAEILCDHGGEGAVAAVGGTVFGAGRDGLSAVTLGSEPAGLGGVVIGQPAAARGRNGEVLGFSVTGTRTLRMVEIVTTPTTR